MDIQKRKAKSSNKPGAVLLTAMMVLMMMMILLSATIGFVGTSQKKTHQNYRNEQAYLTSSSTLESFVAEIQNETAPAGDAAGRAAQQAFIDDLKSLAEANGGQGTTTSVQINDDTTGSDNMGVSNITVAQDGANSNAIKITCDTTFLGETKSVTAHIATESRNIRADFTNTIELTAAEDVSYNNVNVVGDFSGINNAPNLNFSFTNNATVYGSYFMYGTIINNVATKINMRPNLVDNTKGSTITVSENFNAHINDFTVTALTPHAIGRNYINCGGTFIVGVGGNAYIGYDSQSGTYGNMVDVFCTNATITGKLNMKGNMYVYKKSPTDIASGNLVCNGNDFTVKGDLFIEGDLDLSQGPQNGFDVDGMVYVSGSVIDPNNRLTNIINQGRLVTGATLAKSGRDAKPDIPVTANNYVYYPEDFLASTDSDVSDLKTAYESLYAPNAKKLIDFVQPDGVIYTENNVQRTYNSSYETIESRFNFVVDDCCILSTDGLDMNDYNNGELKVLIEVCDDDIIILMPNNLEMENATFVVRNTSPANDPTNGDYTPKYNCYFVSDAGTNISLDGMDANGVSTHSGQAGGLVTFKRTMFLDYETYIRWFTDTTSEKRGTVNENFVLNPTDTDMANSYRPDPSSTIFLLTEGAEFVADQDTVVQGSFYANQADVKFITNGANMKLMNILGEVETTTSVSAIGIIIANTFNNENKSFYVYQKPSPTSVLSNAYGPQNDVLNGYKLIRYDHT